MLLICICLPVTAKSGEYKRSQFYRGITFQNIVTEVVESDIDGDGDIEVLICYREPGDAFDLPGGVMILSKDITGFKVAWHALFEAAYPEKLVVSGASLNFTFVHKSSTGTEKITKTLKRGKDFFFRDNEKSPFAKVKITTTSTLKKGEVDTKHLFDRDLKSVWAEGAEGTGVDEKITFEFAKPVGIGMIGIMHGNFSGPREWKENNRLHRAEVIVETAADRYDTESDVDFETALGLGLYGDRWDLSFSNKPVMRYFRLGRDKVLVLELKITSVLLGEMNDDTYISEIDLAEYIPFEFISGKKKPKKAAKKEASDKPSATEEDDEDDWTNEDDF